MHRSVTTVVQFASTTKEYCGTLSTTLDWDRIFDRLKTHYTIFFLFFDGGNVSLGFIAPNPLQPNIYCTGLRNRKDDKIKAG